ncbi:alanine racemase [Synergistales bacterium]|nr:alanine racemase [Synergistales bacterium]
MIPVNVMEYQQNRAWMEVDLDVIARNYLNIDARLREGCRIMAVLKADAYGLGAVNIARVFERLGCPAFAVATIEEAVELRDCRICTPVLILGPVNPAHAAAAASHNFQVTLVDYRQAKALSEATQSCGKRIDGHIKVDSGLSRFGLVIKNRPDESISEMKEIMSLPGLNVVGVFTHTSAFGAGRAEIERERDELELFAQTVSKLKEVNPYLKAHCLSSSTLSQFPEYSYDFVRIGALYSGMHPEYSSKFDVAQAVGLKARVMQTKFLEEGTAVSYGATFVTRRLTRIAIVSIGYADGLRRSLSNRGFMIVQGRKAPIIGKICCDCTILDVTDIPEAREGDVVTIFGRDSGEEQYVYHYADVYPGSVSEVTATLTPRIPRFYLGSAEEKVL